MFDPVRSLFDVRTIVDVQVFCQSVVVAQPHCRCSGVVVRCRCLLFGVRSPAGLLVLFDYPELSGLSPVRCAQSDNCGGN